jgi:hypothetical protein
MKPIQYIEAMTARPFTQPLDHEIVGNESSAHEVDAVGVRDGLRTKIEAAIRTKSQEAKADGEKVTPEQLAAVVFETIEGNSAELELSVTCNAACSDEDDDHECEGVALDPLGSSEPLQRQINNLFLNAEPVAIVRLSDLERLLAIAKGCRLCGELQEVHCQIVHVKGPLASGCTKASHHAFAERGLPSVGVAA